jgi:hypothetical protein
MRSSLSSSVDILEFEATEAGSSLDLTMVEYNIVTCLVTRYGVWISNQFIGLLQTATTINFNVIADSHTVQFTTARTKSSQSAVSSPVVAW